MKQQPIKLIKAKTPMRYSQEDIDDILARGIKKALEEERVARLARIKRNKLKKEKEAEEEKNIKLNPFPDEFELFIRTKYQLNEYQYKNMLYLYTQIFKNDFHETEKDKIEFGNFIYNISKIKKETNMSTSEWAMPKQVQQINTIVNSELNLSDMKITTLKESQKYAPGIMAKSVPDLQGTSSNVIKLVPQLLQELKNSKDVSDFGKKVSESLTTVADQILKSTNMSEMEQLTKPMSDLLVLCKTVNSKISGTDQRSIWQKLPIISMFYTSIVSTAAKAKTYFTTVESQITTIMNEIERQVPHIKQLNVALERMFEQNQNDYYSLEAHIQAGEKFIEIQTQELKDEASILDVNDKMKVQELQDKQDLIDALSRRVNNFKALQVTCTQNAPSLRSQQQVGKISIEKYNDIKVLIIPAWKKNCARYIISLEQKKSLEMINNIDTTTDTMLRATNDTVNQNGLDAQKALNAGVIKVETLQEINDKLIKSLEELDTVRNQGRADLLENSKKYKQMNSDVNNQAKKMIQSNIDRLTSASN